MKNLWIVGVIITVLAGLNLVQGAALLRVYSHTTPPPVSLNVAAIDNLPPASQAVVRTQLKDAAPDLRAKLKSVHKARRDLAKYIASPHYQRAEAKKRFEDLRARNDAAQMAAQDLLLNTADNLPVKDRALIIATIQ
ncbi:MAG: periplasmic heavy metal sensor [Asticcacaulis sp.]